ncbi:hypothetical protein [Sphingomonas sp.]|uniref:hypothetical protein n=1 Tax=Sphingomonas sp. TaxID=28214 RepID=UPI003B3B3786
MSKAPPKFHCHYGMLDVEKGRKALSRHLKKHGHVPVTIHAVLTEPFGSDDGVSIEFMMDVREVKVGDTRLLAGAPGKGE